VNNPALTRLFHLRFAPPVAPPSSQFDPGLHALRGWAALLVVSAHALGESASVSPWLQYLNLGRGAVLIFFVISGYVIGLTSRRPFGPGESGSYWRHRLVRLVPLYVLAVWFSVAVLVQIGRMPPVQSVLGNLLFLQNFDRYGPVEFSLLPTNRPLWSLNYELVYYAAFLVVWRFRLPVWPLVTACGALSILAWAVPGDWRFLGCYATGFLFWLGGLALAWLAPSNRPRFFPFLGLLLLLAATEHLAPFALVLARFGVNVAERPWMSCLDLAFLPGCLLLVAGATGRWPRADRLWLTLIAGLPVAATAAVLATGHSLHEPRWFFGLSFSVLGTALVAFSLGGHRWLRLFSWAGGISYALYLIHYPMLFLFGVLQRPDLDATSSGLRIAAAIGASLAVAYLFEHVFQPRAARWLNPLFGGVARKPVPLPLQPTTP